jgi:hypothetical protein
VAVTIGIYEKEENVLEGIRLLREAGVDRGEIRIVVSNREGAPLLTSNTDVPVDELYEIQKARVEEEKEEVPLLSSVPYMTGIPSGITSTSAGPVGVILPPRSNSDEGPSSEEVLSDLGIPSKVADQCSRAVESGKYLLIADSDTQTNVQSLLRHAGASDVIAQD